MASLLNTGVSALTAFRGQLQTTSHNIANVNTEGYSRQRVDLASRLPEQRVNGYIGNGVNVTDINRVYDEFLAGRVRTHSSLSGEVEALESRAAQVDDVLADSSAGLNSALQDFFVSVQDVADDPTSIPAREVMLTRSQDLVDRFHSQDEWLNGLGRQIDIDLDNLTKEVNLLSDGVARINEQIQRIPTHFAQPNDLLDQRDQLIDQIASKLAVTTTTQDDGSINVFVGNGQALVIGNSAQHLGLVKNPIAADRSEIAIDPIDGNQRVITEQLGGGEIGGILRFRNEVLDPTENGLGRIAVGLSTLFNEEHQSGLDLDGDLGAIYFLNSTPEVSAPATNAGSISVDYNDVSQLSALDYELVYDGAAWNLTRTDTNQAVALSGSGSAADPFIADGMQIEIGPGAVAGDQYLIRPTRNGASDIQLNIHNTRDIAAADAIGVRNNPNNSGTATTGQGAFTHRTGNTLPAAPITLTFNAALNQFDLSSGGSVSYNPTTDSGSTLTINIAGLGDVELSMNGTPNNGDQFSLYNNIGAVGDNRNARRLADLESQRLLLGGRATFGETFGQLVGDVGAATQEARVQSDVQEGLLQQAESAKSATSGVNLDEEAAQLVRFQQAYQAAAQVISTSNVLFDSLLGAVR